MTSCEKALLPIGIFDSGVGGLTVAQALKQHLPHESIFYLADTASRPFGTKSAGELEKILEKNIDYLAQVPLKMLIVACHTACSLGLERYERLNIPVLGITLSSFSTLQGLSHEHPIIILGTERTIRSEVYQGFLSKLKLSVNATFHPCSCIESMIESLEQHNAIISCRLNDALRPLANLKHAQVLLACTHFPIYKHLIKNALHVSSVVVDPTQDFARMIGSSLKRLCIQNPTQESEDLYLATFDIESFKKKFFFYFSETLGKTNHFFNQTCAII